MKPPLVIAVLLALIAPASASAEIAIGSRSAAEGWLVTVSAKAVRLGPVEVAARPVRPAEGWGHVWLEHDLVLTNMGNREVSLADTWTAAVLGPRRRPMLLADASGLCGYRAVRPLRAACILPLIFVDVKPGRSVTRTVTLWRGIRRMKPLRPGTYVFPQPLRFRLGKYPPAEGEGRTGAVELVYRVEATS